MKFLSRFERFDVTFHHFKNFKIIYEIWEYHDRRIIVIKTSL